MTENHVLELMKKYGTPMTRDGYMSMAYGENRDEWPSGAEVEEQIPEQLR